MDMANWASVEHYRILLKDTMEYVLRGELSRNTFHTTISGQPSLSIVGQSFRTRTNGYSQEMLKTVSESFDCKFNRVLVILTVFLNCFFPSFNLINCHKTTRNSF